MSDTKQIKDEFSKAIESYNDAVVQAATVLNQVYTTFIDNEMKSTATDEKALIQNYNKGLEDAMNACKRVCCYVNEGGLSPFELSELFGTESVAKIFNKFSINDIINIVSKYDSNNKKDNSLSDKDTDQLDYEITPLSIVTYDHHYALVLETGVKNGIPVAKILLDNADVTFVPIRSLEKADINYYKISELF